MKVDWSKRGFVRLKRRVDVLRDVRKLPVVAPDDCKEPGVIPGKMYPDWEAFMRDWDECAGDAPAVGMDQTRKLYRKHIEEASAAMEKEKEMFSASQ